MAYFLHFGLTPRSGAPVRIPGWNLSVKARGVRLPYGENFIILISTILDWFTHVTDRQTDRHTDRQTGDIAYGALNIWNEQGCATTNLPLTIALKCFLKLHSVTAFWRAPQSTHHKILNFCAPFYELAKDCLYKFKLRLFLYVCSARQHFQV